MPRKEPKNLRKISLPRLEIRMMVEKQLEIQAIAQRTKIKCKTRMSEAHLN